MWTIIKIEKRKFNLFKSEMTKKLGSECKFYAPKIKVSTIRKNRKIEKNFYLLGDYIFCHHEKFNQRNLINQLKSIIGLKSRVLCLSVSPGSILIKSVRPIISSKLLTPNFANQ